MMALSYTGRNSMKSLKTKIIILFDLCLIIATLVIGSLTIWHTTQISNTDSTQIMSLSCQNRSNEINNIIAHIQQSVDTIALTAEASLDDLSKFQSDAAYVRTYTKNLEKLVESLTTNTDGAFSAYVRYNPEFTSPTSGLFLTLNADTKNFEFQSPTDFSAYDPSDIEHVGWYYIPVQNKKATWLEPYFNANLNTYIISYVVPIFKDGVPFGVVGMDIDFNTITDVINQTHIYNTGYAFLTTQDNRILWHPTLAPQSALSDYDDLASLSEFLSSTENQDTTLSYTYENHSKNMCYSLLNNNMKFILTAPTSEIFAHSNLIIIRLIITCIICLLIISLVVYATCNHLISPLIKLTNIIQNTSALNFIPNKNSTKLREQKDEIGDMANAIHTMRSHLRSMIEKIDATYSTVSNNLTNLNQVVTNVNTLCLDNSATTQELSAGMEETAATSTNIADDIAHVQLSAQDISQLSQSGSKASEEIMNRATHLCQQINTVAHETYNMYRNIQEKTTLAINQAKSVEQINTLTNAITSISSQTSLLALNASIEAARAGDAGKGFSVVASEIDTLAHQTASTAQNISTIVTQVNDAFSNMSLCLNETSQFLSQVVLSNYKDFMAISEKYTLDASKLQENMATISNKITNLSETITQVTNSIEGINLTISEASDGIFNIAAKTTDMSKETYKSAQETAQTVESLTTLKDIVSSFTLH